MGVMEVFVILFGISLDIFGGMECQGSLMAKIEKKQLAIFCGVLAAGQMLMLGIGNFLSQLLCQGRIQAKESFLGQAAAAVIFFCLGIRFFMKAWKNEQIVERREEIFDVPGFLCRYLRSSLFTLLAGIALGFLGSRISVLMVMVIVMTVLAVVVGIYTGYRLGFEHKLKAYLLGGMLLVAGAIDVLIRYIR